MMTDDSLPAATLADAKLPDIQPPGDAPLIFAAHKLSPLSVLLRLLQMLPQMLIAIIAIGFSDRVNQANWGLPLLITALFSISGAYHLLSWKRFSYRLTDQEIRIESGIFSRNARSIPYLRIQDVTIEQKPLARMLQLAAVRLETGSGSGEDGALNYVTLADAENLREQIKQRKSDGDITADNAMMRDSDLVIAGAAAQPPPIFAMDLRRVLTAGFFNFSLVIFAIIGAVAQNLDFLLPDQLYDPQRLLAYASGQKWIGEIDGWARFGAFLLALSGLILLGLVTGIIRTILREYGFRLDRTANGFRRRRGLLTLSDVAMPLRRIQAAIIRTGPLRKAFGWFSLKFQSLASDGQNGSDHVVAPLANRAEIDRILAEPQIDWRLSSDALHPVHRAFWWVPAILLTTGIAALSLIAANAVDRRFAVVVALIPLLILRSYLRWRFHRYAVHQDQLYVQSGFWKQRLVIIPLRKVQSADVAVTPFSRMFGLARLTFGISGGSGIAPLTIYALDYHGAQNLRMAILP